MGPRGSPKRHGLQDPMSVFSETWALLVSGLDFDEEMGEMEDGLGRGIDMEYRDGLISGSTVID